MLSGQQDRARARGVGWLRMPGNTSRRSRSAAAGSVRSARGVGAGTRPLQARRHAEGGAPRRLPSIAAGARQPRTAKRPGVRASRPAALRRRGRRRAGAATGPPRRTCTAPCARRTSGSPARPAPHRRSSPGPAPFRPPPARRGALPPASCARRTDDAAARVAPSRRPRRRNVSLHACDPYRHVPCPTRFDAAVRSLVEGVLDHPLVHLATVGGNADPHPAGRRRGAGPWRRAARRVGHHGPCVA